MKALLRQIANRFTSPTRANDDVYKEWERLRSKALTPSERAEIDAIFSRSF